MKALLTAAALLAAGQAQALSCRAPDLMTSYAEAAASDLPYLILTGTLTGLPATDGIAEATTATGQMTGMGLTPDGFTVLYDGDVVVNVTCAGPWCGGFPGTEPLLAFVQIDGPVPVLTMGPCGGWTFPAPDRDTTDRLAACLGGAACSAQPLQ